jgi:hypothetical protein
LCFWKDQTGFVLTAELVLISTLLVLGLIVGLTAVQSAVVGELNDVGAAIGSLNQSYYYNGFLSQKGCHGLGFRAGYGGGVRAFTSGSAFQDHRDECDADVAGQALSCGTTAPLPESANPSKKDRDHKDRDKDDDDHKRKDKDDDDDDEDHKRKDKDDDDDDRKRSDKNDKEDSDD